VSTANDNWCADYTIKAENKIDSAIKLVQLAIGEADTKDNEAALLDMGIDLIKVRNKARDLNTRLRRQRG
jgi:hypothetical protein